MILAAATLPPPVDAYLKQAFPGLVRPSETLSNHHLHQLPSTLTENFVRVAVGEKLEVLERLLRAELRHVDSFKIQRSIVFCNHADSCRAVDHFLNDAGN